MRFENVGFFIKIKCCMKPIIIIENNHVFAIKTGSLQRKIRLKQPSASKEEN